MCERKQHHKRHFQSSGNENPFAKKDKINIVTTTIIIIINNSWMNGFQPSRHQRFGCYESEVKLISQRESITILTSWYISHSLSKEQIVSKGLIFIITIVTNTNNATNFYGDPSPSYSCSIELGNIYNCSSQYIIKYHGYNYVKNCNFGLQNYSEKSFECGASNTKITQIRNF